MNALESIGMLTLIVGAVYLIIKNIEKKDRAEKDAQILARYSDKAQEVVNQYRQAANTGQKQMSHYDLNQNIQKVLREPNERHSAVNKMQQEHKEKEEQLERFSQYSKEVRKIGYKHEDKVFEIFDNNRELSEEQILAGLQAKINLDYNQAKSLFNLLVDKRIIDRCFWNTPIYIMYEVGDVLKSSIYSLDESDMTHDKWLKAHSKVLKEPSAEEAQYRKKYLLDLSDL